MLSLKVQKREVTGKKNKTLRRIGLVPGGISVADRTTVMIQLDEKSLIPLTRVSGTEVIEVEVEGGKKYTTVLGELIINPINNKLESFSLTELTPSSHVTVRVPIEFAGIAPAVKNNLGTLVVNMPELKITVNSTNIPEKLLVDISTLETTGARILVSQIPGIEGIKLASEKDRTLTVVTVRPLRNIEQMAAQEAAKEATAAAAAAAKDAAPEAAPAK